MWKSVENAGIFDDEENSEDDETKPEGIVKGQKTNTAVSRKVTNWSDEENSHGNDLSNEASPQRKTASQKRKAKTICRKKLTEQIFLSYFHHHSIHISFACPASTVHHHLDWYTFS